MKKLVVDKKYNEKKLNIFLENNLLGISYSLFMNTLRKKDIKVNGKRINKNIIVYENDIIEVYISDDLLNKNNNIEIKTIYEDDNILIIIKPQNLEVTGNNSLTSIIHKKYINSSFLPMPCHRLDRNTSGLILFAKNEISLLILLEKFKNHEIDKYYYAWVYNIPKEKSKKIIAYLFKDSKKSKVYISDVPLKGYQKIITSYKVLKEYKNNSCLLDVQIETGKTHQIRAHLAHINLPIIGDGKYGKNEINKKFNKKKQCLSSYKLKFNFKTDSNILNYLNQKEFTLNNITIN